MHHPHESPGVSRNGYTPISAFDSQTHEDSTSTELVQDMSKIHALSKMPPDGWLIHRRNLIQAGRVDNSLGLCR